MYEDQISEFLHNPYVNEELSDIQEELKQRSNIYKTPFASEMLLPIS